MTVDLSKPKLHLILEDSNNHDSGLVIDCGGSVPCDESMLSDHEHYEVVGSWQRLSCGIVVDLTTSIEARQDILVNLLKTVYSIRPKSGYDQSSKQVRPFSERVNMISESFIVGRDMPEQSAERHRQKPAKGDTQFDTKYDELRRKLMNMDT